MFGLRKKREGERTPIEMQTSTLNGKRVAHYCTSSGSLKRFCSLAAVCYHPTMLSNRSHRAHRSCFKEIFCCLWRQLRKGLFIANFRKRYPLGQCTEPTQNAFCRDLTFSECHSGQEELLNKGIITKKKD